MHRREITGEFTIAVYMEASGKERQLLGSMELNKEELCESSGEVKGK
jgi:hypothetical protein